MAEHHDQSQRPERPIEFRTILFLYILLGAGIALLIHFILLSTPAYNWFAGA